MSVESFVKFIVERDMTRHRKEKGQILLDAARDKNGNGGPAVWTLDPIIQAWKFCNVRREDDRVTRWITENWRTPNAADPDLWFALLVARFINWPDTLLELGYPVPWRSEHFLDVLAQRKLKKQKVYTGAYMVRADREHADKAAYQEAVVFTPMWNARERLRPREGDTLNSYRMLLGQFHGLGSFMAAQVIADLKYAGPLEKATDWHTFAASGPGSRRGLNRVLGRAVNDNWSEDDWRMALGRLRTATNERLGEYGIALHAQDVQNCLCEFDKYERVRLDEGRPRSKYP